MGANASGALDRRRYPGLADIPENCIATIFEHLSPVDICKLAGLCCAFNDAASCDYVWHQKLPPGYQYLLSLLPKVDASSLSKRQIYALLCHPIPFDKGTKDITKQVFAVYAFQEVYLDKVTGGVCISISARGMAITGIDDHRYWNWIPCDESRFNDIAYLKQIWWLEIDGTVKLQFPAGKYVLIFRLCLGRPSKRLGRRIYLYDEVHGWELKPIRFSLSISGGEATTRECYLEEPVDMKDASLVARAHGNWTDYYAGDFIVHHGNELTDLKFSMTQIDCTHSKGGLCLDSVSILPHRLWKGKKKVS